MNKVFKTLIVSFIINAFLVLIKLITGLITNTGVLVADAVHSLSDLMIDVVAILGNKLSEKKEDTRHQKGHGRIQYLTSLVIGIVVVVLSIVLIKEAIISNTNIIPIQVLIIVLITIVLKYSLYKYLYNNGIKFKNSILISSAKESKADVMSSVSVVFIVITSVLSKYLKILKYADKVGTFIISLFVLKTGYEIIKENLSLIIGEIETDNDIINKIKNYIMETNRIKNVDDVILEKYGIYYDAVIKISVDKNLSIEDAHEIGKEVKNKLLKSKYKIKYVSIHINPYKND